MKKTILTVFTLLIALVIFGLNSQTENISKEKTETTHINETESNYCAGWNAGYNTGWQEVCGTRSSGYPCQGDVTRCPNVSAYNCGYGQGYRKGLSNGNSQCR